MAGEPEPAARVVRALGEATNVTFVAGAPQPPETPAGVDAFDGEVRALYARASGQTPYVVLEADPLAAVREAWRRRFSGGPDVVEEFLGAVRRDVEMPDFYVLLHAERHGGADATTPVDRTLEWYAGLLHGLRPSRVVLVSAGGGLDAVTHRAAHALASLPAGPWWPPVREVLDAVRRFVPQSVALS